MTRIYSKLYPYFWLIWNPKLGIPYLRGRRELLAHEQLDASALRSLQWSRLKNLLEHAYQHVPYYRRLFDEAGIQPREITNAGELRQLPVLTRQDVQANLDSMVATNADRGSLIQNFTGGSTGTPIEFFDRIDSAAIKKAVVYRARTWAGFEEGQKVAIIWGADRDIPDLPWLARQRLHLVARQRWMNSYHLTPSVMDAFAKVLVRWRPRYVIGYAASLHTFAKFLLERGFDTIRPVGVESSAEKLWPQQRSVIERAFGCKVFDAYGSREVPGVAFECEEHQGLHVFTDHVYVELLRDGRPVEPGEVGEIVVTRLSNYAMPLIRYQNGDAARATDAHCPCGRPFPLVAEIIGRANDVIVTPSGVHVHGAFFNHLFYGIDGIQQFQVHQGSLDTVTISVQARQSLRPETVTHLVDRVKQQLGAGVCVELKQVDSIPPAPSGKHRYIWSEVAPNRVRA